MLCSFHSALLTLVILPLVYSLWYQFASCPPACFVYCLHELPCNSALSVVFRINKGVTLTWQVLCIHDANGIIWCTSFVPSLLPFISVLAKEYLNKTPLCCCISRPSAPWKFCCFACHVFSFQAPDVNDRRSAARLSEIDLAPLGHQKDGGLGSLQTEAPNTYCIWESFGSLNNSTAFSLHSLIRCWPGISMNPKVRGLTASLQNHSEVLSVRNRWILTSNLKGHSCFCASITS